MTTALDQASVWMVVLLVLIPVLVAPRVSAQEVATSFEQLRGLVKPGDTVQITDVNGRKTKGKLGDLSASSLELMIRKTGPDGRDLLVPQPRLSERDVREIQREYRDSLWNGTLIGLAVGGGLALALVQAGHCGSCSEPETVYPGALLLVGIGVGSGAGIDALIHARATIYQAPGQRLSGVRLSPLLSKSGAGVQMSVRF